MHSQRLVFFGNECLSSAADYDQAPILRTLLQENYKIEALILSQNIRKSRSMARQALLAVAHEHNLRVFNVRNVAELEWATSSLESEWAVLASFGLLLSPIVLTHFRSGIINIHPSLLPRHRGSTPIETALLEGDQETGISLMRLEEELDAGNIYAQAKLTIGEHETKLSLTSRLAELAAHLLADKLPLILKHELTGRKQNHNLATYTEKVTPRPPLDFRSQDAGYWERHIRAFAGCPNNKFQLNDHLVEIQKARIRQSTDAPEDVCYDKQKRTLLVQCRSDWLEIEQLKPANRRSMAAADFVNGFFRELLPR